MRFPLGSHGETIETKKQSPTLIALVFGLADMSKVGRVGPSISGAVIGVVLLVLAALSNAQIHY